MKQYGRQNDNQVLHVKLGNTGPVDLQCGHIISTCVIVFVLTSYIITVVEGNKTKYIQLKASMDTKDRKENQQQGPLYTNKARMHTSIISFFFSKLFSFVLFTDTNKCISTKNVYSKLSLSAPPVCV